MDIKHCHSCGKGIPQEANFILKKFGLIMIILTVTTNIVIKELIIHAAKQM